tara:strand:- start:6134 stop:7042 length:909 start_codon:yes stop_codon:yes gene_type:complete
MKKKNILITGARGFIGSNLSIYLNKKNFNIFGIGPKKLKTKNSNNSIYTKFINEKISYENLYKNFKNVDFIIHCAGSGTTGFNLRYNYEKNYLTTKAIINFCIKCKTKPYIIFMSSYSVYGFIKSKPASENYNIKPFSSYAKTKKMSEDLLIKYNKSNNLKIKILRLSSIYGDGLKKQLLFDACKKISKNQSHFFGTGNEIRDWLHISDFTNLIYKILKNNFDSNQIINCGAGKGHKVKYVVESIKKQFNSKVLIKFTKKNITEPKNLLINIKVAKSYRWKPKINLYKGIKQYVKWYKKNYD